MSIHTEATSGGEAVTWHKVETLDYIGGEGGFCEPVIVRDGDDELYILHQAYLVSHGTSYGQHLEHRIIEYPTREELAAAFNEIKRRLTSDIPGLDWTKTDSSLGFELPQEEFSQATYRTQSIPWDQRLAE